MKKYVSPKLDELELTINERIATCTVGSAGPNDAEFPEIKCETDDPEIS